MTAATSCAELFAERDVCLLHKTSKDMLAFGTAANGYKASGAAPLEFKIIKLHVANSTLRTRVIQCGCLCARGKGCARRVILG